MKQELIIKNNITLLKMKLSKTDYQAIKFAEGEISKEEYEPIRAKRAKWREEINQLEEQI